MTTIPEPIEDGGLQSPRDSALGDEVDSSTTTLDSAATDYRYQNGRWYYADDDRSLYLFPNDETEQERLDLDNAVWKLTLGEKMFMAPIEQPQKILDLGTGTGIWAIQVADQHPGAVVTGVDISPIQPTLVPPNCKFEYFDYNLDWNFHPHDFIFCRLPPGGLRTPEALFQKAFRQLQPGGWLEIHGVCLPTSDDETIPPDSALHGWINHMSEALERADRDPSLELGQKYEDILRRVRFDGIARIEYKVPQNEWPKDGSLKELGRYNLESVDMGIEAFSMRPFTEFLGWTPEEVKVSEALVRRELRNREIHAYWPRFVVYGQKPVAA
ncbi:hypothetical protein Z517_09253 [Fonsecaea pedrosoi CBS 271.37]|uniref:Methyltransferase domain-containing protein n=1 Tax=Fonsecaea pedrosoi CBS 271.37 TaxID=1442368 RepID=A0A0D2GWR9_9EURO|nr:uncharacterized protein Z517_09253 [Fonsecaea pedrosoi CBS 271.37]KIW76809.1 hypothetical protein Z517_09253 [Fonsecaea pedrosoi CBS 271.37]